MSDTTAAPAAPEPELRDELRKVIEDAEALLKHAARDAGQEYTRARQQLEQSLHAARQQLGTSQDQLLAKGYEVAKASDEYVRSHPWQSLGLAGAIGLALGLLIGRR